MSSNSSSLFSALTIINIAATAGLAGWIISSKPSKEVTQQAEEVAVEVNLSDIDLTPLTSSISGIDEQLASLTTTLQRLNTSTIQFDFLESELEQLAALERGLIMRGRGIEAGRTEENSGATDKAIAQIKTLTSQVQKERLTRRQTLILLISGLEKQLAGLSGATMIADKVPAAPAAVEPESVPAPPEQPEPVTEAEADTTAPETPEAGN